MTRRVPFLVSALLALAAPVAAQEEPVGENVTVTRAEVATAVENREPVGADSAFAADVGTLYFYTVFEGDFDARDVEHVWLRDGEEIARVPLTVRGPRWRTWSSKDVPADWTGEYTVQVRIGDGTVLESVTFTVGDEAEAGGDADGGG